MGNTNPIKLGRCFKFLNEYYEFGHGGSRRNNCVLKTQEQLAKEMDMDVRTLQNYKILADMIPELEDLVDTGIVIAKLLCISCFKHRLYIRLFDL